MMKLFQVDKDMPKLVSDHFIESINGDTSVYGMNFNNIAELHYPHAYEIFWAASIGLSVFLIWQFKKRKWL